MMTREQLLAFVEKLYNDDIDMPFYPCDGEICIGRHEDSDCTDQLMSFVDALLPANAPQGLSSTQEPKYTVNGSAIVNRASGEEIPADEPVFIFRARDRRARYALDAYVGSMLDETPHRAAVVQRIKHFAAFRSDHPERMKEPDTECAPPQGDAERVHQPTNVEDAAKGNVNAIRHVAYAEGYKDGKATIDAELNAMRHAFATLQEVAKYFRGLENGNTTNEQRAFLRRHAATIEQFK